MRSQCFVTKGSAIIGVAAALWILLASAYLGVFGSPHLGLGIRYRLAERLDRRMHKHPDHHQSRRGGSRDPIGG